MKNLISQGLRLGQKVSKGFRKWLKDKMGKCVNSAKSVMQICAESAESAKSAKPIFATYASANFVGKESNESTEMYRIKSMTPSCLFRYSLDSILSRFCVVSLIYANKLLNHRTTPLGRFVLPEHLPFSKPKVNWLLHVSLICVLMLTLGVGNVWGAATLTGNVVYSCSPTSIANTTTHQYWGSKSVAKGNSSDLTASAYWEMNIGSNAGLGSNNTQKAKMILSNGSMTGGSAIASAIGKTTSATYVAAFVCNTALSNVGKFAFSHDGYNNNAPANMWLCYSTDNWSTATAIALTVGTSGNVTFDATIPSAKYAFVIYKSSYTRVNNPTFTFYEGTTGGGCSDPATALSVSAASTTIYAGVKSQLSTSGGNGSTVTYTVTSANSAYATIDGDNKFSATRPGTYTVQASQDASGGTCGGTSTVDITVRYQIKWSVNGDDTYDTGSPTTYIEEYNGKIGTFPTSPAKSACDGSKEFVGWTATPIVGTTNTKPTFVTPQTQITDNTTLYAVFATRTANSYSPGDINDLINGKNVIIYNANQSKAMASSIQATGKLNGLAVTFSSTNISSPDAALIWTVYNSGTKYIFKSGNNYLRVTSNSANTKLTCDGTSDTWTITEVSTGVYSLYSTAGSSTYPLEAYYSSPNYFFTSYKGSGANYNMKFYVPTYTAYATTCCTPLGTINGSINMSSSTDGTVTISGWTYAAGSTGTTESNVSSYTVKLYKWNGSAWAIANASSTTGGSSGTAATRTGIATDSKSVTYSGLEYGETYKFTVTAIGTGSYCDGPETAVTSINGNSLTDNKFLNKYSIYIDDATNANYEHNYITSISSHAGSVDITLEANKDYYQYKLSLGGVVWWGNTGKMTSGNCSSWTFTDGASNCKLQTVLGGAYTFALAAGTPAISVTYPSAGQDAGYKIYFDNSVLNWSTRYYRIGKSDHNQNTALTLVTGTDNFYYVTTPEYGNVAAWHIANNYGWSGSNSIYRTKTNADQSSIAITNSIAFQQYVVTEDITIIPTTTHSTGGDDINNNCQFYTINTPTSGMLTHTATITTPSHGTINIAYTDVSGTSQNKTSTTAGLAHRCILTITATPATGYTCTALTVNGAAFTSGSTHILAADATIAATFTANKYDVTLKPTSQTGSVTDQVVQATYDAAMPTTVKTAGTAIVIPERTGYSFTGWFDNSSGGKQYYQYTGSPKTLSSANAWDKTSATNLYAQWSINSYTLTWSWGGGSTSATSGDDYTAAGSVEYNAALTYPADNTMSRNGYTFNGWSSDATNMPAENLTITAQWTANQYVVTLDANGGVDGATTSVNTTFGQAMPTIAAANLPTRDGYRFDGFYTEKSSGTKYYNADGTSAKNQARYSDNQKLYAHWVAQLTFSVNGAIDDDLTRDVTEDLPSSADVPTACGDCWAFAGWDASSTCSTTPGHAGGENAATHGITTPTTLHAVFGMAEYELIRATSDLEADAYYVLTTLDIDGYEYALKAVLSGNYGTSTDIASQIKEKNSWYYLYNPSSNLVWKFTGNSSSGRLYSESLSKYVDLTGSGSLYKDATSDYLSFSIPDPTYVEFNIASTTTTTQKLHIYYDTEWGPTSSATGIYIYKRQSATYATEPECETYDIVWKVNGTPTSAGGPTEETNTCAGIEELPEDPDDDALDCATKFVGWSEEELVGVGHDAPADLFTSVDYAPAIDEDKIFHAVFATGTPIANTYVLGTIDDLKDGQKVILVNHTNSVACTSTANATSGALNKIDISSSLSDGVLTTSESSIIWTVTKSGDYYIFKQGDNYLRATGNSSLYCDGTSDKWTITDGSVSGTYYLTSYNGSTKFEYYSNNSYFTTYGGTGALYNTDFYIPAESYSDYMTMCCDYIVTLSDGSPSNGTVTFDPVGPIETCTAAKEVSMTITPDPGYYLSAWTSSGVTPTSVDPAITTNNANAQTTTVTFAKETTEGTYTAGATFSAKALEGWTWMYKKDADAADDAVDPYAIPDVVELYKDQYARFIITGYTPTDVIADKQGYVYSAGGVEPAYSTDYLTYVSKNGSAPYSYYQLKGKAPVESTTITFKAVGDASITKTVTIKVKALPLAHFVDNVHNESFADVVATVTTGVVTLTKQTPTHADFTGSALNTCEETHVYLIGWIDKDWADEHPNATHSEIIGAGEGVFYAPNADIDLVAKNGKTYLAVWSKIE